jgi:hypothetical protein
MMRERRWRSRFAHASLVICALLGCGGDDTEEVGKISLHASIDGEHLFVGTDSTFKRYVDPCHVLDLSMWSGTKWVPAQDDRSAEDFTNGYFLDDAYVPPSEECGKQCIVDPTYTGPHNLNAVMQNLRALAYVKVGTKPAPDAKAGEAQLDDFESEPLKGRVKVTQYYYRDADCSDQPASVSAEAVRSDR